MDDLTTIDKGIAALQVVFGLMCLVAGLRNRDRENGSVAPLGAALFIPGVAKFLKGTVPPAILIPIELILFLGAVIWFVREQRAVKARRLK